MDADVVPLSTASLIGGRRLLTVHRRRLSFPSPRYSCLEQLATCLSTSLPRCHSVSADVSKRTHFHSRDTCHFETFCFSHFLLIHYKEAYQKMDVDLKLLEWLRRPSRPLMSGRTSYL